MLLLILLTGLIFAGNNDLTEIYTVEQKNQPSDELYDDQIIKKGVSEDNDDQDNESEIKTNEEDDVIVSSYKYKDRKEIIKFSPQDDCTGTIIHFINHTDKKIKVMAYALTCPRILNALCRAAARGVKIRVLVDKSYATKPYIQKLKMQQNAKVFVDAAPRIAHNKIMLFYNKTPQPFQRAVLTGSFNFSVSAQKFNSENIRITVDSKYVYSKYIKNWRYRKHLGDTHLLNADPNETIKPKVHYVPMKSKKGVVSYGKKR